VHSLKNHVVCHPRCGYHVTCVESGRQLLLKLAESPRSFDLILTDVAMPDVNGLEVLGYVRSQPALAALPVIMMSAHENAGTGVLLGAPPWWCEIHPAWRPVSCGATHPSVLSHPPPSFVSAVFECIQRGAEDYLLKPVTQKEIKQIWQHVWRRRNTLHRSDDGPHDRLAVPPEAEEKANTATAGSKGEDDSTEMYTAAEMKAHCQRQIARYTRILHVIDTHPHLFPAAAEPHAQDVAAAAKAATD